MMKGSGMDMALGARELKHRNPDFGIRVRILGLISDALLTWYWTLTLNSGYIIPPKFS
jgi:hypothetical protein